MLLIDHAMREVGFNYPMLIPQISFHRETRDGIMKCLLFSEAISLTALSTTCQIILLSLDSGNQEPKSRIKVHFNEQDHVSLRHLSADSRPTLLTVTRLTDGR